MASFNENNQLIFTESDYVEYLFNPENIQLNTHDAVVQRYADDLRALLENPFAIFGHLNPTQLIDPELLKRLKPDSLFNPVQLKLNINEPNHPIIYSHPGNFRERYEQRIGESGWKPEHNVVPVEIFGMAFAGKTSALIEYIKKYILNNGNDGGDFVDIVTLVCREFSAGNIIANKHLFSCLNYEAYRLFKIYEGSTLPVKFFYNNKNELNNSAAILPYPLSTTHYGLKTPIQAQQVNYTKKLFWNAYMYAAKRFSEVIHDEHPNQRFLVLLLCERGPFDLMGLDFALEAMLMTTGDKWNDKLYKKITSYRENMDIYSWFQRTSSDVDYTIGILSRDIYKILQRREAATKKRSPGRVTDPDTWPMQSAGYQYLVNEWITRMIKEGMGFTYMDGDYTGYDFKNREFTEKLHSFVMTAKGVCQDPVYRGY